MIFLLDENFPKKSIELLKQYACDFIDIRGTKKEGLADNKIFDLAKKSKSIFLTSQFVLSIRIIPFIYLKSV